MRIYRCVASKSLISDESYVSFLPAVSLTAARKLFAEKFPGYESLNVVDITSSISSDGCFCSQSGFERLEQCLRSCRYGSMEVEVILAFLRMIDLG